MFVQFKVEDERTKLLIVPAPQSSPSLVHVFDRCAICQSPHNRSSDIQQFTNYPNTDCHSSKLKVRTTSSNSTAHDTIQYDTAPYLTGNSLTPLAGPTKKPKASQLRCNLIPNLSHWFKNPQIQASQRSKTHWPQANSIYQHFLQHELLGKRRHYGNSNNQTMRQDVGATSHSKDSCLFIYYLSPRVVLLVCSSGVYKRGKPGHPAHSPIIRALAVPDVKLHSVRYQFLVVCLTTMITG